MPQLASEWPLTVSDTIKGFADRINQIIPYVGAGFIAQTAIAKRAIELWNLEDVALLGGGTPTPLAPTPNQIRYYTDSNVAVVAEATAAGYSARQVDVRNPQDLAQIADAQTIIATGLLHLLDDDAVRNLCALLARTGFQALVFNNAVALEGAARDLPDQWAKLGIHMHTRSADEIEALLRDSWHLEQVYGVPEFYKGDSILGSAFGVNDYFYNICLARAV